MSTPESQHCPHHGNFAVINVIVTIWLLIQFDNCVASHASRLIPVSGLDVFQDVFDCVFTCLFILFHLMCSSLVIVLFGKRTWTNEVDWTVLKRCCERLVFWRIKPEMSPEIKGRPDASECRFPRPQIRSQIANCSNLNMTQLCTLQALSSER